MNVAGRLMGKVALITGAANGIGRAAALLFAAEGARVAIADVAGEAGETVANEIRRQGGDARFFRMDVTDEESVREAVQGATGAFGGLNILYNNAGGSSLEDGTVVEAPAEVFWKAIQVNLLGTWLACRFGIPEMIRSGGGAVVNTASVTALLGMRNYDAYTASKGGVIALTRSLAVEFAASGVRVNAVAPSTVLTERVVQLKRVKEAQRGDPGNGNGRNLLGPAMPEDVAYAALYLASTEARCVTGHILAVDSGLTAS